MSEFDTGYKMGVKEASAEIEKLRKQNKIMRETLEFYANEDNWEDCWIDGCLGSEDYFTSIKDDMGSRVGGYRARQALKEVGEL